MTHLRKILKVVALALALILLLTIGTVTWLFHSTDDGIPVLNYHQINDVAENALTVNTEQFEAQMKYLSDNGYHTITPYDMMDAWENGTKLPDNPVIITFDDGYVDNCTNAFPILEKYQLKATIFMIPDYVGVYPNYLTWAQAAKMQESGLIHFESHTLNHSVLTELKSPEEIYHQLRDSKEAIESRLNSNVEFIAYPCGSYSPEIAELTKRAGYRGAFTVNYGLADPRDQKFILDRVPIFGANQHTFLRFKLRLKYTPIFRPLSQFRDKLEADGYQWAASVIPVP